MSTLFPESGTCIFNEHTAPSGYRETCIQKGWSAFFAIRDHEETICKVFVSEDVTHAREMLLTAMDVHLAALTEEGEKSDYILIPISIKIRNTCINQKNISSLSRLARRIRGGRKKDTTKSSESF